MAEEEAAVLDALLELVVVVALVDVGVAEGHRLAVDVLLDLLQKALDAVGDAVEAYLLLLQRVAAHQLHGVVLEVAATHDEAHRHTTQLVVGKLEAGALVVGVVILHGDAHLAELVDDGLHLGRDGVELLLAAVDRDDDHLDRGDMGRQHEAVVVGVGHDEGADEAGAHTPGRGPDILGLVVLVEEGDAEALGKVLSEEVGRAALQRLAVLHHGLDGVGVEGAGEALRLALHALDDGDGEPLLAKVRIDVEHLLGLLLGLLLGGVGGMALLPQKLARAQEGARAHLPAHHVAPLVAHQGQVAVGVDPVLIGIPDDGLGGGADDELLLEAGVGVHHHTLAVGVVLEAVVSDHGALLGEALHVLGLAAEERLGDEQGEIGVLVAGGLEHGVELALHLLPDGIAVGLDYHAAAHGRLLGQASLVDQLVIPLRIIIGSLCEILELLCHFSVFFVWDQGRIRTRADRRCGASCGRLRCRARPVSEPPWR